MSLRQRLAELTERIHTDADAHMADGQWGFGDWHEAGGSWSGWGSASRWCAGPAQNEHALWRDGGPRHGSGESQASSVVLQMGQINVQAGLSAMTSELRNMAVAVTGLQQAAASATPAVQIPCKHSPESLANQPGLATPRVSSRRVADRSPDHPGAKYQQIKTARTS